MSTAAEEIADLDGALVEAGHIVTFKRLVTGTSTFVTLDALVQIRLYRTNDLVLNKSQTERRLITSPTMFDGSASWPGAAGGPKYPIDSDSVVIDGDRYRIDSVLPMWAYGSVVRIEMRCLGGG